MSDGGNGREGSEGPPPAAEMVAQERRTWIPAQRTWFVLTALLALACGGAWFYLDWHEPEVVQEIAPVPPAPPPDAAVLARVESLKASNEQLLQTIRTQAEQIDNPVCEPGTELDRERYALLRETLLVNVERRNLERRSQDLLPLLASDTEEGAFMGPLLQPR